jgi:hypothetical protein
MTVRRWVVCLLACLAGAGAAPALAFQGCTPKSPPPSGKWPDPANTNDFGTQKWEFQWRVNNEGLEISDVKYTATLGQPKKLVLRRASLPFLPVHYPKDAPNCPGFVHGYSDTLSSGLLARFCCSHVPTTVCNLPDRTVKCDPKLGTVGTCPGGTLDCTGVCVGTQVETVPPLESGKNEVSSGSPTADVLLSAAFQIGLYEFVQRWRFQDNGTIRPSLRAGGVHDCQFHNHQIYWRLHFQLADGGTPAAVVQQCDGGNCPATGPLGWSPNLPCKCGNRPGPATSWRVSDKGVPGRAVIVQTGTTDGVAAGFCEDTTECAPGQCVNGRDFCALAAAEPHETFIGDKCNDHIPDSVGQPPCAGLQNGADLSFWYFAHINHHDPCTFLPMCDPALGTVAFGPTLRLVGSW